MDTHPNDAARAAFSRWNERAARDWYGDDPHLDALLRLHGRAAAAPDVQRFAAAMSALDPVVRETNRDEHLPKLRRYDGQGHRIEAIDFHEGYHRIGRAVYGSGIMARYAEPGRELETLALTYLVGQNGEGGHACPLACTAGLIKILQADVANGGSPPPEFLTRLLNPNYDEHFHGAQFLTEVQGGSDVGANAVIARPAGDGSWRLTGEKWFCSVIDAQLFLVTARPEGGPAGTPGVAAFAVPRRLSDGRTNDFAIRRLKFKLGTRSMASAEVDFQGAWGWPVGDFKQTVGIVLNTSRLYNAVVSCGMLERARREARFYAEERRAFGAPAIGFPAVARALAELTVEAWAARGLTFTLAALSDALATGSSAEGDAWRMLVNLNKYWTSVRCTSALRTAIEVLGGNGAIEEFTVLPRLLRDSIVCEQWEGPHNLLCAQVLRDASRLGLHAPMFRYLRGLGGGPELDRAEARFQRLLTLPADRAAGVSRDVFDELRVAAQLTALRHEARVLGAHPVRDAVIAWLEVSARPGYDPLDDDGLPARVGAVLGG